MSYALPNMTTIVDLPVYVNNSTGGMFGYMLLIVLWVLLFMSVKAYRTEVAFAMASIITTIIGLLAVAAGFMDPLVVPVLVVMTAISIFTLFIGG